MSRRTAAVGSCAQAQLGAIGVATPASYAAPDRTRIDMISASELSVSYTKGKERLRVIWGLDLVVRKGELVSILGPSGCGKSTLLRVVAGLQPIDAGQIHVNGFSASEARERRLFGVVFQDPVLFPWRTALQNVLLPHELSPVKQGPRTGIDEALEMLDLVGLGGFEHAYPNQLSGGMLSRVAIARALVYRPEILLMDEPFGSLDELTRTQMNMELLRIRERTGCTVLFVTHSLHEAVLLGDRILVLGPRPTKVVKAFKVELPSREPAGMETEAFAQHVSALRQELNNPAW